MSSIGATVELEKEEITRIFKGAKTADAVALSVYKDQFFFVFYRGKKVICKIEADTVLNCYDGFLEDAHRHMNAH